MKTGVIDVGGGLRGVYSAGVFDTCIDMGVHFDVCIGISAGSANAAAYLAGQRGRNYSFFTEYPFRKEYMSIGNLFRKGCYLDVGYIYGTLSNSDGENSLHYQAFMENPGEFWAEVCDAETGEAAYFTKQDIPPDDYRVLMASCSIPVVCRPCEIGGRKYFDGALGDTIPLEKAFALGCEKVVLILTKPKNIPRQPGKDLWLANLIRWTYPKAAQRLRTRAERYNRGVSLARAYAEQGKVLIVSPDSTCGVDTLTRDQRALKRLYEKGLRDGKAIDSFLSGIKQG